ncbi:fasciclin domain-containing protein [Phocaeicola plebeius]|uniref:fasciclin domain-containing protein n=1 Tax=Phocaeicola plebeius TaxID=310297 RepID=UPI0026E92A9E|nr:fasciclin domain-containing protein [Phocaeicola plebeius]MCI6048974.1 fasciclin domain-containing protein [Phocaeicola plebeius]MDD6914275.1 fasciclin domain-containing protein [Phocaeicola plebeius]MDY5979047.1 fasciclin domain-containing protein [Phocaeicola plebeius]
MKTLAYYLLGIFSLCILNACENEENPTPEPPPSKGQEEVQKIVEVLKESNPEVSQFVEILEKVNVADLTQDKLTVFAVKNTSTASRAAVLDTASIKNHIAKGSYTKDDLKDGTKLTSISNETLYVTRTEDDVQINGVKIEGNAIKAGNSYVYVVPEVIPMIEAPTIPLHETTIITKLPTGEALAGVNIEAKDGRGNLLGTFITNENGEAIIQHQSDTLSYVISKENFSNQYDGFLIAGMDENGNLIYVDLNGDGLITVDDKVSSDPYTYFVNYKDLSENSLTKTHYMTEIKEEEINVPEVEALWKQSFETFLTQNKNMEFNLLYSTEFNYNNIEYISDPFWDFAYQTIDDCEKYLDQLTSLNTAEGWEASWNLTVDLGVIQTQLFGLYGKVAPLDNEESKNQLIYYLTDLSETLPIQLAIASRTLLGKIYLLSGLYEDAIQQCLYIMNNTTSALDANALNNSESKEVIWGGYKDNFGNPGGSYIHPVLLREVYLMAAIAYSQTGREMEVTEIKNILNEAFSIEGAEWKDYINLLQGTGSAYPYYRLLNISIEQIGFNPDKHFYLPIPQTALDVYYPGMKQNPGY